MLMKKPRHRIFDYPTRFYKPQEDPQEKLKKRLGFQSSRKYKHRKKSPVIWIVFIIAVIFIIIKLSGKG
jgi:type IV secretory pathway component VirB8